MNKKLVRRFRWLFVVVVFCFVILAGRLASLQVINYDYYLNRAERNRIAKFPLAAPRGNIYDRDGELLVTNRPGFAVSLLDLGGGYDPETIAFLSEMLEIEEEEIREKIRSVSFRRYLPVQLLADISPETMARIAEKQWMLQGVSIDPQPIRHYRYQEIGSHLFGFISGGEITGPSLLERWQEQGYHYSNRDVVGQEGLEQAWEAYLRGEDGEQLVETNYLGQPKNYLDRRDPVPGSDLHLTLDMELQIVATEAMERMIEHLREEEENEQVQRGSVVVLDPNSGAILAMANFPNYDPNLIRKAEKFNEYKTAPGNPLFNGAIRGTYPIGSTYKLLTGIAALEEGAISDSTIFTCRRVIERVGQEKTCLAAHGRTNIYSAIARSCNIFFYETGLRTGIDALAYYSPEFGLGKPTGFRDITPVEATGTIASREYKMEVEGDRWYQAETMDAAIGQTFHSYTPLQMAVYVSMIANGGYHYRPYLVERVVGPDGETEIEVEPEILHRADVSEETLDIIREGMYLSTQPGGTGWSPLRDLEVEVEVAAKTGTAEIKGDAYSHGLFVSYAPYEDPEIAIAVILEHGTFGSRSAAPVAREILEHYFSR